jgi:hypothetical protein
MLGAAGSPDAARMTKPQQNRESKENPTTPEEDPATPEDATAMKTTISRTNCNSESTCCQQIRAMPEEASKLRTNNARMLQLQFEQPLNQAVMAIPRASHSWKSSSLR